MKPEILQGPDCLDPIWMDFDRPVEIHVNRFFNNRVPQYHLQDREPSNVYIIDPYESIDNSIKVYLDREPSVCTMKESREDIMKMSHFYDIILTYDPYILYSIPNAKLFVCGTTWLNKKNLDRTLMGFVEEDFMGFNLIKDNTISFLKTNKGNAIYTIPGYLMREKVWAVKNQINCSTLFYYGSPMTWEENGKMVIENKFINSSYIENDGPLPNDDKLNIFKSKFSIIIESIQDTNFFTEKLVDCLLTNTIPIFWGCSNIGDFFDINGFIIFNDENDLVRKLENFDIETEYEDRLKYVKLNFETAKIYAQNYSIRVQNTIKKHLK